MWYNFFYSEVSIVILMESNIFSLVLHVLCSKQLFVAKT